MSFKLCLYSVLFVCLLLFVWGGGEALGGVGDSPNYSPVPNSSLHLYMFAIVFLFAPPPPPIPEVCASIYLSAS